MMVPPSIHAAMQSAVDEGVFPGAVLAVRLRSRLLFISAAGRLSTDRESPLVQPSTMYDLASLTKPLVTVTSILLLVQSGKIQLDGPVKAVLVELSDSAVGKATTADLLTHCSGLPGWRPLYERLDTKGLRHDHASSGSVNQALLDLIGKESLIYERGSRSLYSDLGFILLGLVIERVSGRSLDRWYQEAVTDPLRIRDLLFCPVGASAADSTIVDPASIAPTEYDSRRDRMLQGEVHDDNAAAMGGVAGHAGLFGTAEAVLTVSRTWLAAYHGNPSMLDPSLARRFTLCRKDVPQSSWALGWDTPSTPSSSGAYFSSESFGHLGYTGTSLWIDPNRELEVVLLSNRVHPSRRNEKIRDFRPRIHDLVVEECVGSS